MPRTAKTTPAPRDLLVMAGVQASLKNATIAEGLGVPLHIVSGVIHDCKRRGWLDDDRGRGQPRSPKRKSFEADSVFIQMWNAGYSSEAIAQRMGWKTPQQVRNYCRTLRVMGVPLAERTPNFTPTNGEITDVQALYNEIANLTEKFAAEQRKSLTLERRIEKWRTVIERIRDRLIVLTTDDSQGAN